MKYINKFIFFTILCCVNINGTKANSDVTFIHPKMSILDAIKLVENHFRKSAIPIPDELVFKKRDYIVLSAIYTKNKKTLELNTWFWKIELVHSAQTDHSIAYGVGKNRKVYLLYQSE